MVKLPAFFKKGIYFLLVVVQVLSVALTPVYSDDISDLENEVEEKNEQVEEKESTLEQVKREIESIKKSSVSLDEKIELMEEQLDDIDKYIKVAQKEIELKKKATEEKEGVLDKKKEELNSISTVLYKCSRTGFLEFLLSNTNGEDFLKSILFKRFTIFGYVDEVRGISQDYAELKQEKEDLEKEKKGLDEEREGLEKARDDLVKEKAQVQAQIANRNNLVASLGGQISLLKDEISELQATILVAKSGGSYISAGDVPSGGSGGISDFNSNAPSGGFGVFSIGAFTHRNGMSQWGALARAEEGGQSYTQILSAYYPGKPLRTDGKVKVGSATENIMTNIKTDSYGTLNFENDYMLRLGEMPESWPLEVLKVQAIAARTYAVYKTNNGRNTICVTQSCQVVGSTKKTGRWKTAVEQTEGIILSQNGAAPLAQYAAVHGGWINGVGWDTTDGKGGQSGWTAKAWDSKSGVTWFYKSWNVYSPGMGACGAHSSPWLSNEEMADIINTWLALKGNGVKSSFNSSRILPVTLSSCPISGLSGDPYSMSELRGQLNSPVTSVSGVAVVASTSSGSTITINFTTNRGTFSIPASEFHEAYNSRAPGYLSIPQNGFTHLDVRKK
jgi:peptidoglycan hydrolase CwlO-like protein